MASVPHRAAAHPTGVPVTDRPTRRAVTEEPGDEVRMPRVPEPGAP